MPRTAIPAVLGMTLALAVAAAPASAAPPCRSQHADARGLADGDLIAIGRSTTPITIAGQDQGAISNVVASVPAPATAQATLTAPGKVALALNVPRAGSITLTLSWDEQTTDTPPGSTESVVTCTQTTRIALRAVRPAAIGVLGEGSGFENAIVARFAFPGCRADLVAAPVTVTVRYRLGPKQGPGRVSIPPAPTARSPKLVLVLPRPCADTVPVQQATLPGAGSVRAGRRTGSQLEVAAARRFRGRGAYAAHLRVEFAQPGFKTVRFDVTGTFNLGAGGKASGTTVRRLR